MEIVIIYITIHLKNNYVNLYNRYHNQYVALSKVPLYFYLELHPNLNLHRIVIIIDQFVFLLV
jgi:hypothetical protein